MYKLKFNRPLSAAKIYQSPIVNFRVELQFELIPSLAQYTVYCIPLNLIKHKDLHDGYTGVF